MRRSKTYDLIYKSAYLIFVYAVGIFITLYIHDAYFDIMETKAGGLNIVAIITCPFLLLSLFFKIKDKRFKFDPLTVGLICFLTICIISTLSSYAPAYAWSGSQGWYIGTSAILFLVSAVITLKDEYFKEKYIYYPLLAVAVFEFIMTILSCAGIDLFSFKEYISGNEYFSYFGTLGNSNWCVGYYSLIVPVLICLYLVQTDRIKSAILCTVSVLGLLSSMLNGADGIYLGYVLFAFVLLPYLLDNTGNIRKLSFMMIVLAVSMLIVRTLPVFERRFAVIGGISRVVFTNVVAGILLFVGMIVFLLTRKIDDEIYHRHKKKMIIIIYILMMIMIGAVLIYYSSSGADLSSGRLELWKLSFSSYIERFPFLNKLIGIGPELLTNVYSSLGADIDGRIFVSSHSEFIQLLLTTGILGLFAWIFCWILLFISYRKDLKNRNIDTLAFYGGLFAYLGQSFVNSATTVNVCILSLIIIMLTQNKIEVENTKKKKK